MVAKNGIFYLNNFFLIFSDTLKRKFSLSFFLDNQIINLYIFSFDRFFAGKRFVQNVIQHFLENFEMEKSLEEIFKIHYEINHEKL